MFGKNEYQRNMEEEIIMTSIKKRIEYASSAIRENRIEHAKLKKELKQLLQEFETPEGYDY